MKLQADPTVIYGLREKFTGNFKKDILKEDNEYNTYTRYGLPPTPICSVSKSSLKLRLIHHRQNFYILLQIKKGAYFCNYSERT